MTTTPNKTRILVTGGGGQLARSIADAAAADPGIEAHVAARAELDIADAAGVRAALAHHRPHVVINCAAYTAVDRAEDEPERALAVNAEAAGALARACAQGALPLVHVSTDYVFDGAKGEPYVETDATRPLGVYGRTKLEGERRVIAAGPRHVILRTAWVHSPHGANFVKTMLRLARERDCVNVVGDQRGTPTYAPHLADAILAIARRMHRAPEDFPWGVYHAAGTGETTWAGLARHVFECARVHALADAQVRDIATSEYPTRAARPANSRLDCSALESALGLRLPHWREGVEACVAALAAAPDRHG